QCRDRRNVLPRCERDPRRHGGVCTHCGYPRGGPRQIARADVHELSRRSYTNAESSMQFFDNAPELAPYRDQPPQMPAGAIGKDGFLRLGFERRGARTARITLEQRAPLLAQRALYYDEGLPDLPHAMIVCTTAGVLQGAR